MEKGIYLTISLIFLLCFLTPSVSALGISPGKITMDFVPNEEFEFEGYITNTGGGIIELDVYTDAELKDYLTLLTPDFIVLGPYESVLYRFKLKLPEKFEIPGEHMGVIWAAQHLDEAGGGAVARVKVGAKIIVRVPYPGKYAVIKLDIENANVNDTVVFDITVSNLGKENITNARGEIRIMNMENRTIAVLQTEGKPIETAKSETLRATWFSDVDPGLYQAKVTVSYDGEIAELERIFSLGAPLIKIVNVSAEPVINGTIGKILTKVRSYWNHDINNVYIELFVRDMDGETIAYDKSQNFDVERFSLPTITNYWDTTEGVPVGGYEGLVILHYLDKNDTAEVDLEVKLKPGFFIGIEILIIIAVIIVVAVVFVFFVFYRKRREEFKQKKLM
jgi:hypothetical protein